MKKNKISVITSGSKHFPGHKKRLRFLDKLSSGEISNHIDVFGGHHNPVEDKMDALMPYRYHLALENSFVTDYWTEKLADPLLAWCMPIYYGCPNIREYFPRESCEIINIDDFDLTLRTLWRALESNYHEKSIGSIEAARTMILNDYNIFQLIAEICQGPGNWFEPCQLKPLSFFAERDRRLDRRVMRKVRSLANRLAK